MHKKSLTIIGNTDVQNKYIDTKRERGRRNCEIGIMSKSSQKKYRQIV